MKSDTKKNTPNYYKNDLGCPMFIRQDHKTILSVHEKMVHYCSGRSSDFPYPFSSLPTRYSICFISLQSTEQLFQNLIFDINGSMNDVICRKSAFCKLKNRLNTSRQWHTQLKRFFLKKRKIRITAAGPSPIFTGFPVQNTRVADHFFLVEPFGRSYAYQAPKQFS